MFYLTDVWHF